MAIDKYLLRTEPEHLPTLMRGPITFECVACNGSNVLCTGFIRPGADFGRQIVTHAIDIGYNGLHLLAPWLHNSDFAWACARWPRRFAPRVDVNSITIRHIYTAVQACQIISGGSCGRALATHRALPEHAFQGSAVTAWKLWRTDGILLTPWFKLIYNELVRCMPRLPDELIRLILRRLTPNTRYSS